MERELIKMKRSYKEPETGDLFVLQPFENVYYYGKVIEANIKSKDSFVNGMYLIFVYNYCSREFNRAVNLDGIRLVIAPEIVNKRPWSMGYFKTIGQASISDSDKSIDYGFATYYINSKIPKKYVDVHGNKIGHKPFYFSTYGLGSFATVSDAVFKAIEK